MMSRGGLNKSMDRPVVEALGRWPAPPDHLNPAERETWDRLGKQLAPLRTISKVDLIAVEIAVRVLARLDAAFFDPDLKVTNVASLSRLAIDLLSKLGATPQGRTTVAASPKKRPRGTDPLDEFD